MKKTILYIATLIVASALGACKSGNRVSDEGKQDTVSVPEFSEDSAMASINRQCSFGARTLGSKAHEDCAQYIISAFEALGCEVQRQDAQFKLYNGQTFQGCNIIASYNPQATLRIMLCSHWDSRPWTDNDPDPANHKKPVLAANDGASGVAVMIEVARQLQQQAPQIGVDFVCFDAEDVGVAEWDEQFVGDSEAEEATWCLGSQHWARNPHSVDFEFAVLLDMVGGKGSRFYQELYSLHYASGVVNRVWDAAREAGYSSVFPCQQGGAITDDHLPLNRIAMIPTADIVAYHPESRPGFCPTWHTINDTPANIDPSTLKAVGQTMLQLIYSM